MIHRLPKPPADDMPPVSTTRIKSSPPANGPRERVSADLLATARHLGSSAERLSRIVNGRRASLPPAAAAFNSARRIAQSIPPGHLIPRRASDVPTRDYPLCAHCSGYVKTGGRTDDMGNWFHENVCWDVARGARR
jgi:hypothetical protein